MIVYRNNEKDQENRLKFCIKNQERDWSDVFTTNKVSFYLLSPKKMGSITHKNRIEFLND